ncbi:hypothetical protein [Flavobacterium sp. 3HN19-14]|uniref:hypothetical protein n=1 Tax=Flavobacterium sp. 3HN19-14 TaxID=3448133 RepID=UPI003EE02259
MEENDENSGHLDNYTNEKVNNGIKDLLKEKELKIKWIQELENNESIQNYLKQFHDASTNNFIKDYATQKYFWFKYGDSFKERAENKRTKWINYAHSHLEVILQKKLFDLQCLWRANRSL